MTFTHYVLSRTGPFFKLALLVYLLMLNEIHHTQWLKQNPFYLFDPKSQLDCSTGAGSSTSKMASGTWLARRCWLLTGSLTGAPGWGLSSLRVSLHMTRLTSPSKAVLGESDLTRQGLPQECRSQSHRLS